MVYSILAWWRKHKILCLLNVYERCERTEKNCDGWCHFRRNIVLFHNFAKYMYMCCTQTLIRLQRLYFFFSFLEHWSLALHLLKASFIFFYLRPFYWLKNIVYKFTLIHDSLFFLKKLKCIQLNFNSFRFRLQTNLKHTYRMRYVCCTLNFIGFNSRGKRK